MKQCPELLEVRNYKNIDPITVAVYNNNNLIFFLFINNINNTKLLNLNELLKLAIRNENIEIIKYLTTNIIEVIY
jgi:hypothetical protein